MTNAILKIISIPLIVVTMQHVGTQLRVLIVFAILGLKKIVPLVSVGNGIIFAYFFKMYTLQLFPIFCIIMYISYSLYVCSYRLSVKSNVSDIDECEKRTHNCDKNATCINYNGFFKCSCNSGYLGNGTNCEGLLLCICISCFSRDGISLFWGFGPVLDGELSMC